MPTYFCDSLKDVSIANGVARLEFQRLQAAPGESRELRMVSEFVLAIPTQGLAQTMTLLDGVRERLVRDGVLKAGTAAAEGARPVPPAEFLMSPYTSKFVTGAGLCWRNSLLGTDVMHAGLVRADISVSGS
jgi:hypothetical protein